MANYSSNSNTRLSCSRMGAIILVAASVCIVLATMTSIADAASIHNLSRRDTPIMADKVRCSVELLLKWNYKIEV